MNHYFYNTSPKIQLANSQTNKKQSSLTDVPYFNYFVITTRRQQVVVLRVPHDCVHVLFVRVLLPGNHVEVGRHGII